MLYRCNYAEIARMQRPSKPSSKDLESVEYAQVVGECRASPLLVANVPRSTDMPPEEEIMRKHREVLVNILSNDLSQLLSKLNEKSILLDEELNHLKRLPVKGDQVSLLADLLIKKAASKKEQCIMIVEFLLQQVVSDRLGRIMAEELGMLSV